MLSETIVAAAASTAPANVHRVGTHWQRAALHGWLFLLIALPTPHVLAQAPAPPLAAWVELSPTGPVLRAITDAATCPRVASMSAAGAAPAAWDNLMTVRAAPAPPAYPNRVCEWQPPPAAAYVALEGRPGVLRTSALDPRRIVVFGDSGCLGGDDQDCANDWYFPDIVRHAASHQPDLVVHVGDVNYRGTNCVAYDGCCTYNPINCGFPNCGDNWATWRDDFFDPAAPLFAAAPWVIVRGNHELCSRAGHGFYRYLDPRSPPTRCTDNPVENPVYTSPYALYLGASLRLLVLDSAGACDQQSARAADQVPAFRAQFAQLAALAAGGSAAQTWLLVHRPMWGVVRDAGGRSAVLNYTLEQASGNLLPASISLVISGHEHLFQGVTFTESGFPPALLVGTGGAELDNPARVPSRVENVPVSPTGPTIGVAVTVHDHGYLSMEQSNGSWTATFYDRYDQPLAVCDAAQRPSICNLTTP